jgi:hypothetical protein
LRSSTFTSRRIPLVAGLLAGACLLAVAAPAAAQTGGAPAPPPTVAPAPTTPGAKAKLTKRGFAIAPAGAPLAVQNAIAAANRIRKKPYVYGGGHQSFEDEGYDCSGAVSYVLNAAGMLSSPLPSGPMMDWGEPGKGAWITVFAHGGHAYAVIAGLRWDTSAVGEPYNQGSGPRWRRAKRKPTGYTVRHYPGY